MLSSLVNSRATQRRSMISARSPSSTILCDRPFFTFSARGPFIVGITVTVYLTTELGLSFTLPVWFALSFPVMPIT